MHSHKTLVSAARIGFALTALSQFLGAAEFSSAYRVGYFNLSNEGDGEDPAGFVNSIDATPGMEAALADPVEPGSSWRTPPAGLAPSEWISLVKVKAGRQCDFLAFLFSDRDGTLLYAGRRPSSIPLDPPKYPLTVPPGPRQIPANAIREPATDFLFRFPEESARIRIPLRIVIETPEKPATAKQDVFDLEPGGGAIPVDVAEAMAFAAAFEAGWRPTSGGKADRLLRLSIVEELGLYFSVRARFDDDTPAFRRRFLSRERLYDHLVGLFFQLKNAGAILDAVPYGVPGARLLGWADDRAILQEGLAIRALSPASGSTLWETDAGKRETPRYRMRPGGPGSEKPLVRYDRGIRRLDLADGSEQDLLPEELGASDQFDLAPDGSLALVNDGVLFVCRDRQIVWNWEGSGSRAHPVWGEGMVFVAGADGALYALNSEEGAVRWNVRLEALENARLFFREGVVLVDTGKSLMALNAQDGVRLWNVETEDLLLGEPVLMGARLFGVVKPNRLRVWNLKTGEVEASRQWPTWILAADAVPVETSWQIACVDLRNRLCLLDPDALETLREITFPGSLLPDLAYGDRVPERWSLESQEPGGSWELELVEGLQTETVLRRPAWLVADANGGLYAVAVEKEDPR